MALNDVRFSLSSRKPYFAILLLLASPAKSLESYPSNVSTPLIASLSVTLSFGLKTPPRYPVIYPCSTAIFIAAAFSLSLGTSLNTDVLLFLVSTERYGEACASILANSPLVTNLSIFPLTKVIPVRPITFFLNSKFELCANTLPAPTLSKVIIEASPKAPIFIILLFI